MKGLSYIFLLSCFVTACSEQNGKEKNETGKQPESGITRSTHNDQSGNSQGEMGDGSMPVKNSQDGFWEKLEMKQVTGTNGELLAVMPMPASWNFTRGNDGQSIAGPNGVKVIDYPIRSFMYNYNQSLSQSYAAAGQQMRAMPGVEQLIQEDFIPWANSQGLQLVKYYEIPEISKMDKWYSDQLFKAMPSRYDIAAIGIDWKYSDGKPYFMILHLNVSTDQQMQLWYYRVSGLEADANYFETAKKQLVFSLSNMRFNLEPIMAYNQKEAQRVGQSWAAFNQRMAQNQANFEASQRAHVNRSNAVNDAIMSGWRERNASSDRQQAQTIDGIYERTNVQNTTTGQMYKVEAGANQYWMNNNGEYISTQLQDYNPNLDDNMNQQKWQQLKEVKN